MKTLLLLLSLASALFAQEPRIVILPEKPEKPAPLFFSAKVEVSATAALAGTSSTQIITFKVIQGIPETLTLPLSGN